VDGVGANADGAIVRYGVCSTNASTASKTVDIPGVTLIAGATIQVKFVLGNSVNNVTLNVNSTGAKAIWWCNRGLTPTAIYANTTLTLVYNGEQWELTELMPLYGLYSTCSTAAATTDKSIPATSLVRIAAGTTIAVTFIYGNTVTAPTATVAYTGGSTSGAGIKWLNGAVPVNLIKPYDTVTLTYTGSQWNIVGIAPVTSVAGKTGAVTLTAADVGLGNVNNTTDADKPVSTAQQSALDARFSATSGHRHDGTDSRKVAYSDIDGAPDLSDYCTTEEMYEAVGETQRVLSTQLGELNTLVGEMGAYSSNEVVIGTWINGAPIYRRVMQATSAAAFTEAYQTRCAVPSGLTKIINGFYVSNAGTTIPGAWRVNDSNMQFYTRSGASTSPSTSDYGVLEYLK